MDVSMSQLTLDADAAAFNAALLVAIASAILRLLSAHLKPTDVSPPTSAPAVTKGLQVCRSEQSSLAGPACAGPRVR